MAAAAIDEVLALPANAVANVFNIETSVVKPVRIPPNAGKL
jgi:hypothetical protein